MGKVKTLNEKECFFCGSHDALQVHHIFGFYNRKKATEDGLCVWLCRRHHTDPKTGVHYNREMADRLRMIGQQKYEETHTREEFIRNYGRNYL